MKAQPMPRTFKSAMPPSEAAKRLRMSVPELAALRRSGRGPEYLVISRRTIRYLDGDLHEWSEQMHEAGAS